MVNFADSVSPGLEPANRKLAVGARTIRMARPAGLEPATLSLEG